MAVSCPLPPLGVYKPLILYKLHVVLTEYKFAQCSHTSQALILILQQELFLTLVLVLIWEADNVIHTVVCLSKFPRPICPLHPIPLPHAVVSPPLLTLLGTSN
jgi:hypothetical protein